MKEKLNSIKQLRWVGIAEGISFLFLLGIAMPLKYYFNYPPAVKVTGWIHGMLFILYILAVAKTGGLMKWKLQRSALFMVASVLPFATFILDKSLKKEESHLIG